MSDQDHDLASEFPGDREALHRLKLGNAHYNLLAGRHHALNKEIARIENGLDPASDLRLEELKKERLSIADEVALLIAHSKQ